MAVKKFLEKEGKETAKKKKKKEVGKINQRFLINCSFTGKEQSYEKVESIR